jgi:hypothetical protein
MARHPEPGADDAGSQGEATTFLAKHPDLPNARSVGNFGSLGNRASRSLTPDLENRFKLCECPLAMGSFDIQCSLSGLPLEGVTVLLLTDSQGHPVAQPLSGVYDTYGGIELAERSITTDALWKLKKTSGHPTAPDLEALSVSERAR